MTPNHPRTAILHYSAPPVVGGVEAVMLAHARTFTEAGLPVTVIAGRGDQAALPAGVALAALPEIDSRHPQIMAASAQLADGQIPASFDELPGRLAAALRPLLEPVDALIVHNVFTKQFNLPLTAALDRLLDDGTIRRCIAWCHDFAWTSPRSRADVHPGYPWDLLRTMRDDVTYVVVSRERQATLAGLYGCAEDEIHVVYNGVDPQELLGLAPAGADLIARIGLLEADLVLLMPVRVTVAKNIELALEVVAALKHHVDRPLLVLTGPPDPHDSESMAYFHSLQDRRAALGVEDEVRFVFESGPDPDTPYLIDAAVVGDLFRVSDVMFMPSHREGFGMPVLEAGLAGVPVVATGVPAAREIGADDVTLFGLDESPRRIAQRIVARVEGDPVCRLRRLIRQQYTWQAIFQRDILPLLTR
ncbi:MAG: glycosyltransferase family 4 protein [Caldilineales bacterium]